ncbi:2,3-dihydro-2,3-dihydroxybenzoate dehydrogenase [Pseudothauera rhizosphaerae]|uniref:2,3-dihydro-2,3-dihydroxybenzoate dehydrogenase n=1 Tax=Pseudothauera rhizosphaerae TaxID=2565932 RepID=A0A4S4AAJ0_9RHOO|nr:2,3-dihydro-2,3-dihydroxybenzoate dehydrogenase [Pseudothauera rhizosphaerae]THF55626.1 2,3-dihydro-2,3-dihydroxybenzoate dehydrogenase [Pseudothauera rhizosphaerae]
MNGKLAIVSGAAQGIGAAIVDALVVRGARVAALDVQGGPLEEMAARHGGRVRPYAVDLRASREVERTVAAVENGMGEIGMLAHSAGILRLGGVTALSDRDWEDTFAVNVHGVFYLARAVARHMVPRRRGAIVTVGSNAAAVPRTGMAAYAASKAAVCHFTKCLGLELAGFGIRCNVVSPGSTDTAMQRQLWQSEDDAARVIAGTPAEFRTGIPLGRIARPQDIAEAVLFLLGDGARHITMHELCVDGGATLGV